MKDASDQDASDEEGLDEEVSGDGHETTEQSKGVNDGIGDGSKEVDRAEGEIGTRLLQVAQHLGRVISATKLERLDKGSCQDERDELGNASTKGPGNDIREDLDEDGEKVYWSLCGSLRTDNT